MARAIDAELLKENCKITGEFMNNFECVSLATLGAIIDKQPTIEAEPVKQEWISVKDRLPERDQKVLVYDAGDETEIHVYHLREDLDGLYWDDESGWAVDFENVTHWMPLPEPPKEGE